MARIRERPQSIYVMEAPSGESKIGISESPRLRWGNLRFCFPRGELRLLFASESSPRIWMVETVVHAQLADKRLNGEWFDVPSADAISLVKVALAQHWAVVESKHSARSKKRVLVPRDAVAKALSAPCQITVT